MSAICRSSTVNATIKATIIITWISLHQNNSWCMRSVLPDTIASIEQDYAHTYNFSFPRDWSKSSVSCLKSPLSATHALCCLSRKKFGIEKVWVAECKPLKLTNKCHCLVDRNLRMTGIIILQSIYDDAYGWCAVNCGPSPSQRASMRFLVWSEFERLAAARWIRVWRDNEVPDYRSANRMAVVCTPPKVAGVSREPD